jgi:UDP-N-acetylmuramoylalanine--D-glutamate ligase
MEDLKSKRVTVAGLGTFGGNLAAARWLVEQGAKVLVTDKSRPEDLAESVAQLQGLPINFRLGEHRTEDFTSADLIVASPAIPPTNPYLAAAREAGVPIVTEIMLFIERCPGTVLGVTGTKGKSTTTAMLGRMLQTQFTTFVGGNIGRSLLPDLPRIGKKDLVVLELSSFMLHYLADMRWSPHIAVVTMVAADHLDWHGSAEAYVDAKRTITRFLRADDYAVLNKTCPVSRAFPTPGHVVTFGAERDRPPFELLIPGEHNQLNAQAAFAAASILGVPRTAAQDAIRDFAGLPHRLALVHEENGVRYFDDSIATVPEAAIAALHAFPPKKVVQIVGGHDKGLSFTDMCAALLDRAKAVLCIGQTGDQIADSLVETRYPTAPEIFRCGDLPTAMKIAKRDAKAGDVVLLSTGCASYGQFRNFQERGEMFARLAKEGSIHPVLATSAATKDE